MNHKSNVTFQSSFFKRSHPSREGLFQWRPPCSLTPVLYPESIFQVKLGSGVQNSKLVVHES